MLELEKIRESYKTFDDVTLKKLARTGSKGLRPEVVPLLIEEIQIRGLESGLIDFVHADRRDLSDTELNQLKSKVKNCVCQECKRNRNLKAYRFETKIGIVLASHVTITKIIVCTDCGEYKRKQSALQSILLGWLSVVGFISYPLLVYGKIKEYYKEDELSDQLIEDLIRNNIGTITLGNESNQTLTDLISTYNGLEYSSIN